MHITPNIITSTRSTPRARRRFRRIGPVAGLAAVALLITGAAADAATPLLPSATRPAAAAGTKHGQRVRDRLTETVAGGVPGAAVLIRTADRVNTFAAGSRDLGAKALAESGDRYRIGSITKTMVAAIALQLVDERKLSLEDTVERWAPGLVPNGRSVHLRELLNMTAGLYDYLNDDQTIAGQIESGDLDHPWTPRELVAISNRHAPHFAPGRGWHYCNTCYVVAGLMIEKATGHSLQSEFAARLIKPLGLHQTTFDAEPRMRGTFAHGYELLDASTPADVSAFNPTPTWAAGNVVSTIADTDRFLRALLSGRVVSASSLRSMKTFVAADGYEYGLGLARFPTPCGNAWGNVGGTLGFHTFAVADEDASHAAMVFTSLGAGSTSAALDQAEQLLLATAFCG